MSTESKNCNKCGHPKPLDDFHRNRANKDGRANRCKACHKLWYDATDQVGKSKQWHDANPKSRRNAHLKYQFGISQADYESMLLAQNGVCAICEAPEPGGGAACFHVDHDHETGRIRKLLCNRCNLGIGYFRDNPNLLRTAATYLETNVDGTRTTG